MKTRRKSLFKRGLSFFIAVTMCLSMLQMPVFAAEAHEHNQDGWECVWIEGSEKLDCKHEHDEECYRPGKDVLNCEDDHHTEECYGPGEDILICEDDSEEHEHNEDCYAPGEDVLKCKENHHTEDCYVSGEDELNCSHEHDEDCYIVTEGRWECTAPEINESEAGEDDAKANTAEADEPSAEKDTLAGDELTVEHEKEDSETDKTVVSDEEIVLEETKGKNETSANQTNAMQEDEPDYTTVDDLEAAFMTVGERLEDGDIQAGIAALDKYLDIYSRLSPEDQKANAEAQKAALAYRETLQGSLEGIEDPDIEQNNTYAQITVNYVVNGVTLRTDTLNSGRYIQIGNQVPYVSDLIRGTQYADYDYGTVTKIECRPLQYFPPSAHTLREGQNIEHSGNYKTHTITYTTSKWEKRQIVTPPVDGGNGGGNNGNEDMTTGGSGKYLWNQTLVYHANYPGGNDPTVTVKYNARGSFGNMTVVTITPKTFDACGFTLPEGYSLEKNSWYSQSSGGSTLCSMGGSFLLNYDNRNTTTHLYAHYKNNNPVSPATYSYQLTWDYNGGTLDGKDFDQENALNLTGDDNATHTFYEQANKRPSRSGYIFEGWAYSGNGFFTESNGQITMIGSAGNTVSGTMTAKWKLDSASNVKVTLTYDANQGKNPPAAQEVMIGSDVTIADKGDMTRDGYTFLGWSTKSNPDTDDVNTYPEDILHMETNITLYAVWSTNPSYTVKWYDTEESEIKKSETRSDTAAGETVSVTEDDKKVAGYTFDANNQGNKLSDTLKASGTVLVLYFTKDQTPPPPAETKNVGIQFYKVFKGDLKEIPLNEYGRPAVNYEYKIFYNEKAGGPFFDPITGPMECEKVDKTPSGNMGIAVYKYTATVAVPKDVDYAQLEVTETNKEIDGYTWSYETRYQGNATLYCNIYTPENPMTFNDFTDVYTKIPDSPAPSVDDLEITKTVDKSTVTVGEEVTYTIEVKNTASQAVEVDVVDELPEEMFTEAPTVSDGGTYDKDTHIVTWNKVSIPAGETKTLTVTVKAVKSGTFTNTARVVLNGKDKPDSVEVEVKEKDPSQPLVPKLEVTKKNDGFKTDQQTGNAFVKYTITVTNISGFSIYGLRITDTLDQPTVTKVNPEDVGEAEIKWTFKDFKVKTSDNGKWGNATPSGKEDDLVHVLQPLARNDEFADGQTVTLTYTIEIENLNDDVAVKVKLDNTAVGASWSKKPTDEQVSRLRMSRSELAAFAAVDDDEPDVTDSASSSASSGEISGNGSSSTEGELPRKYSVIYTWDLPEGAKQELPTEPKHPSGAVVSVDTKYTSTTEIEVNGKTYIFSGWSTDDAVVENHQFTMPAKDVTIHGIWKEKNEGNPNVPDKPGTNPETHKVTVHYVYTDGSKAADDAVRDNLTEGTAYSIPSPGINGYTPDQIAVNGTMGKEDIVLTVTYTRDSTGNPGGGSSGGGGGGGGSTATNQTGRVHGTTPSPESEVTVPGDGVPLAEIPEGTNIADEDVPLAGIPVADIPDADVPLAGIPDLMYIPNDDVPLARVPKTGDSSGLWHMMALLSAFGLMAVTMMDRKKRQEKQ